MLVQLAGTILVVLVEMLLAVAKVVPVEVVALLTLLMVVQEVAHKVALVELVH